ncbi:MerR family transcriptional regulator [Peribacillus deserti]|uniref:MerR family transcriptional regulator n=1 Tax=Peribacillus deserti TaxID=673318 RepID=A0A2N5M1R3_9BACI|nr:MerR family transcriptional regulator [Peribacillus deserti]PLT28308.1 MerR family transcriptional regulator [Peribacillus deserti]
MVRQVPKYNIKAASNLLGIKSGTLRAWERRYQFIAPVRNESGHRMYTEEHIRILKWLVSKVNQGFTISQAVTLLESEGQRLEEEADTTESNRNLNQENSLVQDLMASLLAFNENKAHELMDQIFSLYTIEKAIIDVLGNVIVQIGDLWERGKITVAHEHFATSILRSRIGYMMHAIPQNSVLPKAAAFCAPGEQHELGLLIFTLFLRLKGFQVVYLGQSMPSKDLQTVISIIDPKLLFLSCTLQENLVPALRLIDELQKQYPDLQIGIGGRAVLSLSAAQHERYSSCIVGENKKDWNGWIQDKISSL